MAGSFYAMLSRMKHINRWALMRNTREENLCEHSQDVAVIAHALAVLTNTRFGGKIDEGTCVLLALYHDAPEILTGDLPTPVKYYNPDIKKAYKQVERIAGNRVLDMLPQELRSSYEQYVLEEDQITKPIVKAADKLSAHIKCLEEQKAGNTEFESAAAQTMTAMKKMEREELDWFIAECLPAFSLNLDQL